MRIRPQMMRAVSWYTKRSVRQTVLLIVTEIITNVAQNVAVKLSSQSLKNSMRKPRIVNLTARIMNKAL